MIQGLYEIRKNESEKLFTMWLDAFHDYPKLAEAFPQMDKKLAAMEATIRFYGMYDLEYGHAYATDENIDDGIVIVDSEICSTLLQDTLKQAVIPTATMPQ